MGLATDTEEVALLETQAELGKVRKQQAEDQAKAEGRVTGEIKEQTDAFVDQAKIRRTISQTTQTKDYTDRQLEEKAANLRRQLDENSQNQATGQMANPFAGIMAVDLEKVQNEISYRAKFRGDYAREGESALRKYSAFDEERLRQYIRPEDEKRAQLTLETLQDIQSRLAGTKPIFGRS
jgi:ribosomal protein L29